MKSSHPDYQTFSSSASEWRRNLGVKGAGPPMKEMIYDGRFPAVTMLFDGGWHFSYFAPTVESIVDKLNR